MEDPTTSENKPPQQRTRRAQVANACIKCRDAKLKVSSTLGNNRTGPRHVLRACVCSVSTYNNYYIQCSATRPVCDRCLDRDLACIYDASEGMTKRQQERVDLIDSGEQLHRCGILLDFLRRARIEEGEYTSVCLSFWLRYEPILNTDLAIEMLARLRSGFSLDSEYVRVQDRFRFEDGVFVLQQQQEFGGQGSSHQARTRHSNIVDHAAEEASQREYAELIRWSNTNIDPQLLERDQRQREQQR